MGLNGVLEALLDKPIDLGVWVGGFEGGDEGDGAADIAEGAWADEEDAVWCGNGAHGGQCSAMSG